jgi:hypothetical protein
MLRSLFSRIFSDSFSGLFNPFCRQDEKPEQELLNLNVSFNDLIIFEKYLIILWYRFLQIAVIYKNTVFCFSFEKGMRFR